MENDNRGVIYVLIAAIAFSLGGLLVKLIPYSALAIASGRCVFSSVIIGSYFVITKRKLVINKTTIIGGLFVMANMLTYIVSNQLTTAANAIVLEYTSSIFIIIFSFIFFRRMPNKKDIIATALVFVGIILVFVEGIKTDGLLGIMIALLGGLIYSLILMSNAFKGGDSTSSMLIGHVLNAIIFSPFLIKEVDVTSISFVYLIIFGVIQSGLGFLMLSLGTKHCEPLTASLVASIEPVLDPILVALFYHETMTPLSFVGISIVIITIIAYNALSSKRRNS